MGLIEDYSKLVGSIQNISCELQTMQERLAAAKTVLEQTIRRREMLIAEQSEKEVRLLQQQLETLTAKERSRISQEQARVAFEIESKTAQLESLKQQIQIHDYKKQLKGRYKLRDSLADTLEECKLPSNISGEFSEVVQQKLAMRQANVVYTDNLLKKLQGQVTEAYDAVDSDLAEVKDSISDKLISFILLKGLADAKWSNKSKLMVYIAYCFVVVLACLTVPIVPLAVFSLTVSVAAFSCMRENKMCLKFVMPYVMLQTGVAKLDARIESKLQKLRADAIADAMRKAGCDVEPLLKEQEELNKELLIAPQRVRQSISDEELRQLVVQEFAAQVEECQARETSTSKEIHKLERFVKSDELNLPRLREKQKAMLLQIKDAYLNPSVPGTALTLTESFFLGIDEAQGTLIEFKFGGKSTLIMYKGANCHTNKVLITMMLMQLLSSMSISVLDIYLTDQVSAGTDYAVFFQKELQDKMHLCATENDTSNAISELHEALILRTREILTEAPSLADYNETMLSRKSLPREYIFLFLQDPTDKQMVDQNLQQILANGPLVGIIPIVFISHSDVNGLSGQSADSLPKVVNFFKLFHGSTFIFDGVTNDLNVSDDLDACIIEMLERSSRTQKGKGNSR